MALKYIITFQDSVPTEQINAYMQQIHEGGGSVTNRFPDMIARGFSAYITDSVLLRIQSDPSVIEYISPDSF